jgi:hypothetical protein
VLAIVHVHVLQHTLDPFGIVLVALALAGALVIAGLVGSRLIGKTRHSGQSEIGHGKESGAVDS